MSRKPGDLEHPGLDILETGWWLIDQLIDGRLTAAEVSSAGGILRIIAGYDGPEDAATLAEVELRGRLMHGLPPRDEAEWEFAASLFNDDAMAEFRRWEAKRLREEQEPD